MTDAHADTALVQRLSSTLHDVIDPLLAGADRCALLGFPNHNNVGDNAIWLGEKAFLEGRGPEVVYQCDLSTYHHDSLRRCIGDGTILLHGGGNLGDVWPVHQEFREHVVSAFPNNRIVQLPQSIFFRSAARQADASRTFGAHEDLTILARDERSLRVARALGARAELAPDMAFALGPLGPPRREPTADILWLARTDREASPDARPPDVPAVTRVDWFPDRSRDPLGHARRRWTVRARVTTERLASRPATGCVVRAVTPKLFDRLARRRVASGLRLLGRGRVVVTDRLHGHILCLLLGIPHVLLENSYGKLSAFVDAFSGVSDRALLAASPEGALRLAEGLLEQRTVTSSPGGTEPDSGHRT